MVVHSHYPLREIRVEREARVLIDHGYEVDVICLRGQGEPAVDEDYGVRIYRLPVKRRRGGSPKVQLFEYLSFFALAFARLTALHRRRRYSVVQVHNVPDFLIFTALVPKLTGARLILDLHDLMPEFYASRFNRDMQSWPVRLLRWQERLSCAFADHVITVTELWRQTLIRRGLPPEKVSVVMNVADDRIFQREQAVGQQVGRNGYGFHMIYHGTLTRRYGIDLAIRAVDLVRHHIPGIRLTIHGTGEYASSLMELVAALQLEDYVHFSTRTLPSTELPKMIMSADVGIVPYRSDIFTDGILPTKLMEYAALGVPAIAARTPAIAAYFDETMVQFFTPGDVDDLARCIMTLYADRNRLVELTRNVDRFIQRYNWASVSANYVALVDSLNT